MRRIKKSTEIIRTHQKQRNKETEEKLINYITNKCNKNNYKLETNNMPYNKYCYKVLGSKVYINI